MAPSTRAYPELYALVGPNVPDYRGLFLRGLGGNSADLGQKQDETVYIDPSRHSQTLYGVRAITTGTLRGDEGIGGTVAYTHLTTGWPSSSGESIPLGITNSEGVTETRPANTAVRYLIRALP